MRYSLTSLLLLFCLSLSAQIESRWVMSVASFSNVSAVNDSTHTADLSFQSDQTGNGYLANGIAVGYRLLTNTKGQYRVDSVLTAGISTATLRLVEIGTTTAAPSGTAVAYQYDGSTEQIPLLPVNSAGISAALAAVIQNHNVGITASAGSGGGSGFPITSGIYYVSKQNGDNATAQEGDISKPWADPFAASWAAPSGSRIEVLDGYWTFSLTGEGGEIQYATDSLLTLSRSKSQTFYFPKKSGLENVSTTFCEFIELDSFQRIEILGEGTFKGNDNVRLGKLWGESYFYLEADTVQTSPVFDGIDDAGWRQNGFFHEDGTRQNFVCRIQNLVTNFDVFSYHASNHYEPYVNIWVNNHHDRKGDGAFHIRNIRFQDGIYTVHTVNHYAYNPEWYVFGTYRADIIRSTINASVDNIYSEGPAYTWNHYFAINEDGFHESTFNLRVGSGYGPMRLLDADWDNGGADAETDSLQSNSTFNIDFNYTWTGQGAGNPCVRFEGIGANQVYAKLNITSQDTVIEPVSVYNGVWNEGGVLLIEGAIRTTRDTVPCIVWQAPDSAAAILGKLHLQTNSGPAISGELDGGSPRTIFATDLFTAEGVELDPDLVFVSPPNFIQVEDPEIFVLRGADLERLSTDTAVVDSAFDVTLSAGLYEFEAVIQYAATNGTGIIFKLVNSNIGGFLEQPLTDLAISPDSPITGGGSDSGDSSLGETRRFLRYRGVVEVLADGLVQAAWGTGDDQSVNFAKVYSDSYLRFTKIE